MTARISLMEYVFLQKLYALAQSKSWTKSKISAYIRQNFRTTTRICAACVAQAENDAEFVEHRPSSDAYYQALGNTEINLGLCRKHLREMLCCKTESVGSLHLH